MKKKVFIVIILFAITSIQISAQQTKPVKTGNEWKMPSDVFKRSKNYADNLQKKLELDSVQTKKIYEVYLANTKSLDEISVAAISEREKDAAIKANKTAFSEKLKAIFTTAQYSKYLKLESRN